jgi:hypothetical protein
VHGDAVCALGSRLFYQRRLPGKTMKQVTVHTYRQDPYYPRVVRAVATILARADVVAPVDVLMEMGNLTPKHHEAWRRGHVPSLERVFAGSLSKANRILRLLGFHVHDLNMLPRRTVYRQWGQGTNRLLRFSKSGNPDVEKAYATHYVWNQSQEKKRHVIAQAMPARRDDA